MVRKDEKKTNELKTHDERDNLARIRDNQRRSRARRKEYLIELEQKLQKCRENGAQASTELQQAARNVLEENKRLRALLRAQGMLDHEIESSISLDSSITAKSSTDSLLDAVIDPSSASGELDALLTKPKPCTRESCCNPQSSNTTIPTLGPATQLCRDFGALRESANPYSELHAPSSVDLPLRGPADFSGSIPYAEDQAYNETQQPNITVDSTAASRQATAPYNLFDAPELSTTHSMADEAAVLAPTSLATSSKACCAIVDVLRQIGTQVGPELKPQLGCVGEGINCRVDNAQP